jgi:hypothetical protein
LGAAFAAAFGLAVVRFAEEVVLAEDVLDVVGMRFTSVVTA